MTEFPLIDLKAEMLTRRKQMIKETIIRQRERLSEEASLWDDAIVRSHTNMKYERLAEMTNPFVEAKSNNLGIVTFTQ